MLVVPADRVQDALGHARDRRLVRDAAHLVRLHDGPEQAAVQYASADKGEIGVVQKVVDRIEPAGAEVVEDDHAVVSFQKCFDNVAADEPSAAGNQDRLHGFLLKLGQLARLGLRAASMVQSSRLGPAV